MSSWGWRPGSGGRRREQGGAAEIFGALGLAADAALTDDEIRMAWRRVASATHPDRADGGDPAAFAAAASAYSLLRTRSGRGEALGGARGARGAGGTGGTGGGAGSAPRAGTGRRSVRRLAGQAARLPGRISAGRPWRLAARVAAAVAVSAAALAIAGGRPAGPALVTGAATGLILTARRDLAP